MVPKYAICRKKMSKHFSDSDHWVCFLFELHIVHIHDYKSIPCNIQQFHATLTSGENLYSGRAYLSFLPCTIMYHMGSPHDRAWIPVKVLSAKKTPTSQSTCGTSASSSPPSLSSLGSWETHSSSWTKSCTSWAVYSLSHDVYIYTYINNVMHLRW